jgi:putative AdoMet-dependent methyltransferase
MNTEFPPDEFDSWADSYDQSVTESGFPFEGYSQVLNTIVEQSEVQKDMSILDLGAGTGNLSALFYPLGCRLWCLDFSGDMLRQLKEKLPETITAQADIRGEWPREFGGCYDRIVSAYTFHHFPLAQKVELASRLIRDHLNPGGKLVIGDLAFDNTAKKEQVRRELQDQWDDEYYWIVDEAAQAFKYAGMEFRFTRNSKYAGVFRFGI